MNFYETVKKVRVAKGISQKNASKGYISQANYSKFENGKIDITSTSLMGILDNLNIELEEMLFIENGYQYSTKEQIYREFFRIPVNDPILLENLMEKCSNYLAEYEDSFISFIHQIALILIKISKNNDIYFNKEESQHLLNEFSKKEHLFIKDLYIINSIFFLFPIESAHLSMDYIEKALAKYGDFQSINRIEVNLRMNYSLMLIKENLEEQALYQLQKALPLVKKFNMSVIMGIVYVRMGICFHNLNIINDIDYIQKGKKILDVLDEIYLLDSVKIEIDKYLK